MPVYLSGKGVIMFIKLSSRIVNTDAIESFQEKKLWFIGMPNENLI